MSNEWIIERDKATGAKVRRQRTDTEQAAADNRPARAIKPYPDIEGALRLLMVGHQNETAIKALLDRKR